MEFNVAWVYVVSFLDLLAISLTIPLLSVHLRSLGASHFLIGLLSSVYAGAQLFSGPVVGSWSDKKGRQSILVLSLLICTVCYIFMGIFHSLFAMLLLRILLGIFKHIQVLTRIIVADRVPLDEQSLVSGRLNALAGVGFMLGPAIGGNIAELENGFTYVCYCTAALFAVNIVITHLFLQDPPKSTASTDKSTSASEPVESKRVYNDILRAVRDLAEVDWAKYWDVFALKLLMAVSLAMFTSDYSLRIQDRFAVTPKWAGYTISIQGFTGAAAGFFAGYLDQRFYKDDISFKQRNLHGFTVMAISFLGVFVAPNLVTFTLWTVPLRASSSLLRIVGTEMLLKRCQPSQKGSLVGTGNSVTNVARLITPLVAGVLGDFYGIESVTIVSFFTAAAGISLATMIKPVETVHFKSS